MKKSVFRLFIAGYFCLSVLSSCTNNPDPGESTPRTVVPVTYTTPRTGKMTEYTELIATSAFLVKTVMKAPVSGYIEKCEVTPGDKVQKNQVVFQLQTKESQALQQDHSGSINISGNVKINATLDGIVASIDHPQGDFVQEGDALATVVVPGSLVFLLEVPYEMKAMVRPGSEFTLVLPDNTSIMAVVKSVLPSMSGASQTQRMVLQPRSGVNIPENLMAKVKILQNARDNAIFLPKSTILNDEIMKNFWVMKLVNDSMAVKIPVITGMMGTDSVEIVSPLFNATDRILTSGNYGLGDTATVRIIRNE